MSALRVGAESGAVAMAYAEHVAARLGGEVVELTGAGRDALLAGDVDVLVSRLSELPTDSVPGVALAAVPKRADARDALCAAEGVTLEKLPEGARVGVDSPRRRAQVLSRRPDLQVVDIAGDAEQQFARLEGADDERVDAVILAAADLERLGRAESITERFDLSSWPTTPGQGALAVETRSADAKRVSKLAHATSRLAVDAERGVLARVSGWGAPFGVSAMLDDGLLFVSARAYALDGSASLTSSHAAYPEDSSDPAAELAERVAAELRDAGAADLAAQRESA